MSSIRGSFLFIYLFVFCSLSGQENRSIDGVNNNLNSTEWGSAHSQLLRLTTIDYTDSISSPAGVDRLNPREISNILFDQKEKIDDKLALSDYIWVFGQFIDHDVTLVENFNFSQNPEEAAIIFPPLGDPHFGPGDFIPMMRSLSSEGTGTDVDHPRQHDNAITSFIDASGVYGVDLDRANWLRTFENGKLKTSNGENLPWNTTDGFFNSPIAFDAPFMESEGLSNKFYIAGDVRANENPLLISLHTIFLREHNRLCDEILKESPGYSDELVYQLARKVLSGKLQSIVYNEWLPVMNINIPSYTGYIEAVNPGIYNVFSAAAFRLGHTLINSNIIRMKDDSELISRGNISLKDAFFNPLAVELAGGVEPYIIGMATQIQQDFDCKVVGDVRNFLFGEPGDGGLDLAAININRGRERGLPDYNTVRADFGLPKVTEFTDLCVDPTVAALLEEIYVTVDNIDPWVGMLSEKHVNDGLFGELVMTIMERQFRVLRDGDRFYFENDSYLTEDWKEVIRTTTLRDIVMRNTNIKLMQKNVFKAMDHEDIEDGPEVQESDLSFVIYPNPILDVFSAKIYSESIQTATLQIFNTTGLEVFAKQIQLIEGENIVIINIDEYLETGIYNVLMSTESEYSISRFLKK